MGHYAKVLDGKVQKVIRAQAEFFETFVDADPGEWIKTSYNTHQGIHLDGGTPLRGNFAGVGDVYDAENDVFYAPKPAGMDSWVLNTTKWIWEPPVEMPDDGNVYDWDEAAYQEDNTAGWVLNEELSTGEPLQTDENGFIIE
jgi:hypothetical protein